MKRIWSIVLAGFLGASTIGIVNAQEQPTPFRLGSRFNRNLQTYTGITGATNFMASQALTLALKMKLHGKVKAKVTTWSLTDLFSGKIKSVDVKLANSDYKGVPLGNLHVQSNNPIWIKYFKSHGQRAGLLSPVLFKIEGDVSGENVADGLASPIVSSQLKSIKLELPGLGGQMLQFLDPKVSVRADGVQIKSVLATVGAAPETGVPIKLVGTPELVGNSRIFIRNLQLDSPDIPNPEEFADFSSKLINPLVDLGRMDRTTHAFRLESLKILDNLVHFNGNLLLAPKPTAPGAAKQVARK